MDETNQKKKVNILQRLLSKPKTQSSEPKAPKPKRNIRLTFWKKRKELTAAGVEKFDMREAERRANKRFKKEYPKMALISYLPKKSNTRLVYGEPLRKDYAYKILVVESMIDMCREKGWTKPGHWKAHEVPMLEKFKEAFQAGYDYADIVKYYAKQFFAERQDLYV